MGAKMAEIIGMVPGGAERFAGVFHSGGVTEELGRITKLVRGASPPDAIVTFSFDGRLQIHVDVRKREHVMLVELTLKQLEPGLFDCVSVGGTPRHPFYHRVSAMVHA